LQYKHICKAHNASNQTESEAVTVTTWTALVTHGWKM